MRADNQTFLVPQETNRRAESRQSPRTRLPRPGDIDHPETHHRRSIENDARAGLFLEPKGEPHINARIEPPTELESSWRHGHWRVHRQLTWEALNRIDPYKQSTYRFARCGAGAVVARDKESGKFRVQSFGCKHRLCSACRKRTAGIIVANVMEHAAKPERRVGGMRLRSITLTIKHSDSPLSEQLTYLMKSFAKLRKNKLAKKCLRGGFYVIEIKVSERDGCWHPHIHLLAEGTYVAHADLQAAWMSITGDSHRVHVTEVKNLAHEVGHHCKYLTKAADASIYRSAAKLDEYIDATHGRRLAAAFGSWRGLRVARPNKVKGDWIVIGYLDFIIKEAGRGDERSAWILKNLKEDRDGARAPPSDP